MTLLACLLTVLGAAPISGQVVDAAATPLPGVSVYAELGAAGSVLPATTNAEGRFAFPPLPGKLVGIIAHHTGKAFGVLSVKQSGPHEGLTLRLEDPVHVSGVVKNSAGAPIVNARITRVLLLGAQKGSIPLAKLSEHGIDLPRTNQEGAFRVSGIPNGCPLALKVEHPAYATEAVLGLTGGQSDVQVTLYPGVEVSATVLTHGDNLPLARAVVEFRNAAPPNPTTLAVTNRQGKATVRLKPGVYVVQALTESRRSAGLRELRITGDRQTESLTLRAAPLATVEGGVRDAVSDTPIEGAHVVLFAQSNVSDRTATDRDGAYRLEAPAGEVSLLLHDAPGYVIPEERVYTFNLTPGETRQLPVFWLKNAQASSNVDPEEKEADRERP